MTVKARGIRLKKQLSSEDQGQRKLMQVTYSQLAALQPGVVEVESAAVGYHAAPDSPPLPAATAKRRAPSNARRRAVARMLRIELEATLAFLDRALDDMEGDETTELSPPCR